MEASYQKYKGRINFRWVYGREGHPSDANHKGGSYELGWRHPDSVTKSMKDRAQRAVWMKTDPDRDYEIPMMIDFINDPPNKDDAIKKAYGGSGYYSGHVIDCNGKVLSGNRWGWGTPKNYYGLPINSVTKLHKLLDDYLKNPSPCYVAPPPGSDDDEPEIGCSVARGSGGGAWALLLLVLVLARGRPRPARRVR